MRKNYYVSQALMTVSLLIVSSFAVAQSSFTPHSSCQDPDCAGVCNAVRAVVERDTREIDNRTIDTIRRISDAKSCVERITTQVNRQIPSLGGGSLIDSVVSGLANQAAQKACAVYGNAVQQTNTAVNSAIGGVNQLPGIGGQVPSVLGTQNTTPPNLPTPQVNPITRLVNAIFN